MTNKKDPGTQDGEVQAAEIAYKQWQDRDDTYKGGSPRQEQLHEEKGKKLEKQLREAKKKANK